MTRQDWQKKLRQIFFVNLIGSGIVDDKHSNSPERSLIIDNKKGLYALSFKTKELIIFGFGKKLETVFEQQPFKIRVSSFQT